MGNFLTLCTAAGSNKVLQVMKTNDGKILEFRAPMRVKDLLINYPNFYVGIFKEATQALPLDYKLKIGKIYYLLQSCTSTNVKLNGAGDVCVNPRPGSNKGAKRIKVVITRQQLRELLSNQTSVEDLVQRPCNSVKLVPKSTCLKSKSKKLQSIPEENETVY